MIKFFSAKRYDVVMKDVNSSVQQFVNDERDTDRFFEKPKVEEFLEFWSRNYDLLRSDKKEDRMVVYMMSVYFVSELLVQLSLFHRVLIFGKKKVGNQVLDLPIYSKSNLPLKYKQVDKEGQPKDYSNIRSLDLMKKWYQKNFK